MRVGCEPDEDCPSRDPEEDDTYPEREWPQDPMNVRMWRSGGFSLPPMDVREIEAWCRVYQPGPCSVLVRGSEVRRVTVYPRMDLSWRRNWLMCPAEQYRRGCAVDVVKLNVREDSAFEAWKLARVEKPVARVAGSVRRAAALRAA